MVTIIYVPVETPGYHVVDKVRYLLASAWAELREGMDAEPRADDLRKADRFAVQDYRYNKKQRHYIVTIRSHARAIREYLAVQEEIA